MLYGDWEHICLASSEDGKTFTRYRAKDGKPQLFSQSLNCNTRDPMALPINGLWHCYYTAYPDHQGAVFCRTSKDLAAWSGPTTVAFGGQAGTGPFSAECPFVVELFPGQFYLFRTQRYGTNAITRVYQSTNPLDFGVQTDQRDVTPADKHLVASLPVAAPELVRWRGQWYIAYLLPSLKGIQLSKLKWRAGESTTRDTATSCQTQTTAGREMIANRFRIKALYFFLQVPQSPPTIAGRRILAFGQVFPSCPAPQRPEDAFN